MRRNVRKITALIFIFALVLTGTAAFPQEASAASYPTPQRLHTISVYPHSISIQWDNVVTGMNGAVLYRGKTKLGEMGEMINGIDNKRRVLKDHGLKANTRYRYRVRFFTEKREYYNTTTKKWQNTKPASKNWEGRKSRTKKGTRKYGPYSKSIIVKTKKEPKYPKFTASHRRKLITIAENSINKERKRLIAEAEENERPIDEKYSPAALTVDPTLSKLAQEAAVFASGWDAGTRSDQTTSERLWSYFDGVYAFTYHTEKPHRVKEMNSLLQPYIWGIDYSSAKDLNEENLDLAPRLLAFQEAPVFKYNKIGIGYSKGCLVYIISGDK